MNSDVMVFLSMEEDMPMAVFVSHGTGITMIPLEDFFTDSKIGMGQRQRNKYAAAFEIFTKDLRGDYD
jgi:hypothetical protein